MSNTAIMSSETVIKTESSAFDTSELSKAQNNIEWEYQSVPAKQKIRIKAHIRTIIYGKPLRYEVTECE